MKIALVHKRLDLKGGTERDLFRTAQGLSGLGHDVHLFCSEFGVDPPAGVTGHRVPVLPLGRTLRLWSFAWLAPKSIKRIGCDMIVNFGRLMRQDILRSGGGTHRGFLERMGRQGGGRRRLWQSLSVYHRSLLVMEGRQFQECGSAKIIAVSQEVKNDIVRHYPVPPEKIVVVYNGVDLCRFHPKRRLDANPAVRIRWHIPLDSPLVLFVGSGFQRKGLDRLFSVWQSPRLRDVYLLVVGDDARLNRYATMANAIAPDRIVFAGRQDDVENYYAAADVVALPSLQEAFGNVVLEALASGVPVLVSRDVGATEILSGLLTQGIVERPEDLRELEEKLLFILAAARDPIWRDEARRIGESLSWENHFKQIESVLHQACPATGQKNFTFHKRDGARIWIDESFAVPSLIDSLAHADRWFQDPTCQIIKDQEKTKVGRLIVRIGEHDQSIFLKQFNAASLRHWIGSWFVSSRAFKTLEGAAILRSAQVPIAIPFAAVEQRKWGGLTNSLFLTREVIGGKTTDAFWQESLRHLPGREGFSRRRSFLRGLAEIFHSLHAQRIYHNDLKEANILTVQQSVQPTFEFFLLDLEGVRRCLWLSDRRRVKNLVQLYRTFGRHISRAQNLYFLKGYLGPAFLNRKHRRQLILRILDWSRRLEASKTRRMMRVTESIG